MRAPLPLIVLPLALGAGYNSLAAEPPAELLSLSLSELTTKTVQVASLTETSLLEAPAVVSVITSAEIQRMGARDLRDVLRFVPGFELGVRSFGYPAFGLRGVITDNTEKIRILLDGLPVNENLEGSATIVFGDLALDNVDRIEIIRGPGSALYGTNAFVGVISIITKPPPAFGSSHTVTARGGSFDSREVSLQSGWSGTDLRTTLFLHYLDSEGDRRPVERDPLQFITDPPFFSNLNAGISLAGTAQGQTEEFRRKLTLQLKTEYGGFFLNAVAVEAEKGPNVGAFWVVNTNSEAHPSQLHGNAGYKWHPHPDWELVPRVYALQYKADNLWNTFPPGYRTPDGQGGTITYTQGRYDRNGATQLTSGGDLRATWNPGFARRHTVVMGLSREQEKIYDHINQINSPGTGPEGLQSFPPILLGNPRRTIESLYVQEQWRPSDDFGLTAGVRQDRYDDAGNTTNPRLALVWQATPPLTLKLLYGEAFRAPTFVESYLYVINGFLEGHRDNRPETIKTGEVEALYRHGERVLGRLTLFRSRITDLLFLVPKPGGGAEYKNSGEITEVNGLEAEVRLTLTDDLDGFVNYSTQSGRNETTGTRLVGMANWRANAGVNVELSDRINVNIALNVVGDRRRNPPDPRPALDGYRVLDAALTYTPSNRLSLQLRGHNLFDTDQRYPDISGSLPNDFPREGRAIELGVRWNL